MKCRIFVALIGWLILGAGAHAPTVVGVGSCNHQTKSQEFWDVVGRELQTLAGGKRASAWLWVGDMVYADTRVMHGWWYPSPPDHVEQAYAALVESPPYQRFVRNAVQIVDGVWDDHDYNMNNGDFTAPRVEHTQKVFLDSLGVSLIDERRHRKGVYSFLRIPHVSGKYSSAAFCVIFLDARTFLNKRDAMILGEEQWAWLEKTLKENVADDLSGERRCDVVLIATGVQVLSQEKPAERWNGYAGGRQARARLINALARHRVGRAVLVTGDVHLSELFIDERARATLGYPLIELTTSGLTHSSSTLPIVARMYDVWFPSPRRRWVYLRRHFASLSLHDDDEKERMSLRISVHTLEDDEGVGRVVREFVVPLKSLTPNETFPDVTFECDEGSVVGAAVSVACAVSGGWLREEHVIYIAAFGIPLVIPIAVILVVLRILKAWRRGSVTRGQKKK